MGFYYMNDSGGVSTFVRRPISVHAHGKQVFLHYPDRVDGSPPVGLDEAIFQFYTRNYERVKKLQTRAQLYNTSDNYQKFFILADIVKTLIGTGWTVANCCDGPDHISHAAFSSSGQSVVCNTGAYMKDVKSLGYDQNGRIIKADVVFMDWSGIDYGHTGAEKERFDQEWVSYACQVEVSFTRLLVVKCRVLLAPGLITFLNTYGRKCLGYWCNPHRVNMEFYLFLGTHSGVHWTEVYHNYLVHFSEAIGRSDLLL